MTPTAAPAATPAAGSTDAIRALLSGRTREQQEAIVHGPGPLLVFAGPGAGKTATLTRRIGYLLATGQATPTRILAVTFTVAAAGEMRLRLIDLLGEQACRGLTVATFHSVCARILRTHASVFGRSDDFTIYDQVEVKKVIDHLLSDKERATIQHQLTRFGQAASKEVLKEISLAKNRLWTPDFLEANSNHPLAPLIACVWREVDDELRHSNAFDFDDLLVAAVRLLADHPYLHVQYQQRWPWLLVDEFQDTNYAQMALVRLLAGPHGNLTIIADDDQCLVAGTPITMADGTWKPIEEVRQGDRVLSAQGAGRMGPATVQRTAKRLATTGVRIRLASGRELTSTPEHTHFAAFRPATLEGRFVTYLMFKRGVGYRIGMASGAYQMAGGLRLGVAHRVLHERAQAAWILGIYDDELAARTDEAVLAARYGLPQIPFRRAAGARSGLMASQEAIDEIYAQLDTESAAQRLACDHGLGLALPHHAPQSVSGRRNGNSQPTRYVRVTLCGHDNNGPSHKVSVHGTDHAEREPLDALGFQTSAVRGGSGWNYATSRRDYGEALGIARTLAGVLGAEIRESISVGRRARGASNTTTLPFIPAAHVRPGMVMATAGGDLEEVLAVDLIELHEPVYDLDIEGTHNFVADGVVTHNSIYRFRGAEPDNVLRFREHFPAAQTVTLGVNFRSNAEIVSAASQSIAHNAVRVPKRLLAHNGPGGLVVCRRFVDDRHEAHWICSLVGEALAAGMSPMDIMLIARTSFTTMTLQHELASHGIPHRVLGSLGLYERAEVKDAIAYLQLLANGHDGQAFRRAISSPKRGVGAATASRIIEAARAGGIDLISCCQQIDRLDHGIRNGKTREKTALFGRELDRIRLELHEGRSIGHTVVEAVMLPGGVVAHHQQRRDASDVAADERRDAERVLEDLRSLCRAAASYEEQQEEPTLAGFLEHACGLDSSEVVEGDDQRITISTIHRAKGTEASLVVVLGCEERVLPSWRTIEDGDPVALEEERRLFYVAGTRAKHRLVFTVAARRGERDSDGPSRFLAEAGLQPA